jgi:SecD/SecF fusion protein
VANVALALNVVLTIAGMSLLGATLTLPGIAGIVLGIGPAVDANVLLNERIREEAAKGKGALRLFWFGSGPVRGFAITTALGILISIFTAVSVVKVMMIAIARARRLKTIDIQPLFGFRPCPDHTTVAFMEARRWGLGLVAAMVLGSAALLTLGGKDRFLVRAERQRDAVPSQLPAKAMPLRPTVLKGTGTPGTGRRHVVQDDIHRAQFAASPRPPMAP